MTDEQATMASAPTPDRVFTPRAPVDDQMFVNRVGGQIGYKLTAGMSELGSQVIVYGTDYTYFNAAIGLLCQEKYGGLLRKRRQHGRGIYSFVNPLARPFIRMMDEQGIDFDEA